MCGEYDTTQDRSAARGSYTQVVCTLRRICVSFLLSRHPLFPPSAPFHPSRTETNDHFIVVRASCTPIHRRIISGNTLTGILAFLEWVFLT